VVGGGIAICGGCGLEDLTPDGEWIPGVLPGTVGVAPGWGGGGPVTAPGPDGAYGVGADERAVMSVVGDGPGGEAPGCGAG